VGRRRRDAGTIAQNCDGVRLALFEAVFDPRCEISAGEWSGLAGSVGTGALRQEGRREGDAIVFSIVNAGARAVVVPLRFHPSHPELAFSVVAETDGKGLFELGAPKLESEATPKAGVSRNDRWSVLAELDGGSPSRHVYHARIRLLPGGRTSTRLTIDPSVVRRLDRRCGASPSPASSTPDGLAARSKVGDGGADANCLPARLPRGHVVLHIGQLITGIEAGEPARIDWEVP
jgi:hypothetical protein